MQVLVGVLKILALGKERLKGDNMKKYEVFLGGELYTTLKDEESAIKCAKRLKQDPRYIGSVWVCEIVETQIYWEA